MSELAILIFVLGFFLYSDSDFNSDSDSSSLEPTDLASDVAFKLSSKPIYSKNVVSDGLTIFNKNGIWVLGSKEKTQSLSALNTEQQTPSDDKATNTSSNGFLRLPDGSLL